MGFLALAAAKNCILAACGLKSTSQLWLHKLGQTIARQSWRPGLVPSLCSKQVGSNWWEWSGGQIAMIRYNTKDTILRQSYRVLCFSEFLWCTSTVQVSQQDSSPLSLQPWSTLTWECLDCSLNRIGTARESVYTFEANCCIAFSSYKVVRNKTRSSMFPVIITRDASNIQQPRHCMHIIQSKGEDIR